MPVSKETVTWGYKFFLGREPESDEAVGVHVAARDETHLAELLIRSAEFRGKRRLAKIIGAPLPLDLPGIEVETAATPEQLAACAAKIKVAWTHLGDTRPHFSVLTNTQFLPGNLSESIEQFWASGESEAAQIGRLLSRHGFSSLDDKTCLEYGCGVGRVTMALATRFREVHAYDISHTHLSYAAQRRDALGATNVTLHECSTSLLDNPRACDFFYSRIVFQHNPPPIIAELIRQTLSALRSRGIGIFQVPTYIAGYRYALEEWLRTAHPLDMQMHCIPQEAVFALIAKTGCTLLEVREDDSTGRQNSTLSNTFVVRKR